MNKNCLVTVGLFLLISVPVTPAADRRRPAARAARVSRADQIDCQFQDWQQTGYYVTPSEDLTLVFRNRSRSNGTVRCTVDYRLTDAQYRAAGKGTALLSLAPRETKTLAIAQPRDLPPGRLTLWYRVKTADGGSKSGEHVFLIRSVQAGTPLSLRVVQWTDCLDPEGYAEMIAGPAFRGYIENLRQWPKQGRPDVVVVKQPPLEDSVHPPVPSSVQRAALLQRYLAEGGSVLLVGPLPAAYDALSPLVFRGGSAKSAGSRPLRIAAKRHPLFSRWGRVRRASRSHWQAEPKRGAGILATWDDGSPALAQWRVGNGRLMHLTCGLGKELVRGPSPSGADELYLRCLYALAGRTSVDVAGLLGQQAARRHTPASWSKLPDAREGLHKDNYGGFGWNNDEGLMAVVDAGGQSFMSIASTRARFQLYPDGARPGSKHGAVADLSWTRKRVVHGTHTVDYNDAAPGVAYDFRASRLVWLDFSCSRAAWEHGGRVRSARTAGSSEDRPIVRGKDLSANWLAFWGVDADGTVQGPLELVLTRRPEKVFRRKNLIGLVFSSAAGRLVAIQPLGIEAATTKKEEGWGKTLPDRAVERCRFWAKAGLARPASVKEAYRVDAARVRIENLFEFELFENDWNIAPVRVATLSPMLPLAKSAGLPVAIPADAKDLLYPTKCGPLHGRLDTDRVVYSLPIPNRDHQGLVADVTERKWQGKLERFLKPALPFQTATAFGRGGYQEDLRELIYREPAKTNLFSRKFFPLTRAFPTTLTLPAANDETARRIRTGLLDYHRQALEFYQEKTLLRHRTEPFSQLSYGAFNLYPVRIQDGVRMFQDLNEFSGILLYSLWAHALYTGDWDMVRDNWSFVADWAPGVLPRHNYWSMMASSASESDSTVGFDMLHAEYPGWAALAGMARVLKDERTRAHALYMATKSAVPLAARFAMDGFLKARAGRLPPEFSKPGRTLAFHEKKLRFTPETKKTFRYHICLYDTASGTSPEMMLFFKQYPPLRDAVIAHERRVGAVAGTKHPLNIVNMYAYQMLGMASPFRASIAADLDANMAALAQKYRTFYGWRTLVQCNPIAKYISRNVPVFLIDWAPFAYESGRYDPATREAVLVFSSVSPAPFELSFASRLRLRSVRANGRPVLQTSKGEIGFGRVPGGRTVVRLGKQTKVELRLSFDPTRAAALHQYFTDAELRGATQ